MDEYRMFWGFMLRSALRYPWVRMTEGSEAVTLWIPPGGEEFGPGESDELVALVGDVMGPRAGRVLETLEAFGAAHPTGEPHFFLSLWGTHEAHRGKGVGTALIHDDLALIDAEHMPCYLESTNDANLGRYENLGFERFGSFEPPGGPVVTTMWRPAR